MNNSSMISATCAPDEAAPILDVESTLLRLGGDQQLFSEMAGFLLDDAPPLFQDLRCAVEASDSASIHKRAHALRGMLAGCGGVRASQVAHELEFAGEAADLGRAEMLVAVLEQELDLLVQALTPFLQESRNAYGKTRQGSDSADSE